MYLIHIYSIIIFSFMPCENLRQFYGKNSE